MRVSIAVTAAFLLSFLGSRIAHGQSATSWNWFQEADSSVLTATDNSTAERFTEFSFDENDHPGWERVELPGSDIDVVADLAVSPDDADHLLLGYDGDLYESVDAGTNWQPIDSFSEWYDVRYAIFAPSDAQRVFIWTSGGLYGSKDGGESWSYNSIPYWPCIRPVVAPSDANRIYMDDCSDDQVVSSDDGGETWIESTPGFTTSVRSLAVSPIDASVIVAADWRTIRRSKDGGRTWSLSILDPVYRAEVAYSAREAGILYAANFAGIYRSIDNGVTWENAHLYRGLEHMTLSPSGGTTLIVSDAERDALLLFSSTEHGWHTISIPSPGDILEIWRSNNESQHIYVLTSDGLWRYSLPDPTTDGHLFLPIVMGSDINQVEGNAVDRAIARANHYRDLVGTGHMLRNDAIVAAAQNHAGYYLLNHEDPDMASLGAHREEPENPGFTGVTPAERVEAAGYQSPWGASEVMHFLADPLASVDGWGDTVYHRLPIIAPFYLFSGYGLGCDDDTCVDVMNFTRGTPTSGRWSLMKHALAYPVDGQTEVPTSWNGLEIPNPLPDGASRPVGYPVTLQGVDGDLQVDFAELRDSNGTLVPTHPSPVDCDPRNCYTLIPIAPLNPHSRYTVYALGNVSGVPFDRNWTFTTGEETVSASSADLAVQ